MYIISIMKLEASKFYLMHSEKKFKIVFILKILSIQYSKGNSLKEKRKGLVAVIPKL